MRLQASYILVLYSDRKYIQAHSCTWVLLFNLNWILLVTYRCRVSTTLRLLYYQTNDDRGKSHSMTRGRRHNVFWWIISVHWWKHFLFLSSPLVIERNPLYTSTSYLNTSQLRLGNISILNRYYDRPMYRLRFWIPLFCDMA